MKGALTNGRSDLAAPAGLNAEAYGLFREFIYRETGINLGERKQALVQSRLARRVALVAGGDFFKYFRIVSGGNATERQIAIDRLTTNETHFFREPAHFRWFGARIRTHESSGPKLRVWSAAASTGEEAYSIAMICMDRLGEASRFEILGTDVNQAVVEQARRAVYSIEQASRIPEFYRRRYCLRGVRSMSLYFRIATAIQSAVRFEHGNLLDYNPGPAQFEYIFLRNVLIYFDRETKRRVVENLAARLAPGGYLITGHSESLHELSGGFRRVQPSIYELQ